MYYLIIYVLFVVIDEAYSVNMEIVAAKYFESETVRGFRDTWQKHRKSFESAISRALQESYGYEGMNIYIRRPKDSHRIAPGLYLSDNTVELLLLDMYLREVPHLKRPDVTIALASNVMRLDTTLTRMFVDTKYIVFRNQSEVLYSVTDQDPFKNSPFSYQQVQTQGDLAIVVEDCTLTGNGIVTLNGYSVNLGHSTFKLKNCKFSVEISAPGMGSPPVMAPYFSKAQSVKLERLMMSPIRDELLPKLQGILFTYLNTSSIFGDKLMTYQTRQRGLFQHSAEYMTEVVSNLNKKTIEKNDGVIKLPNLRVYLNDTVDGKSSDIRVLLAEMTLSGLDSAYTPHVGGPFLLQDIKVDDVIRYNALQVRGKLNLENDTYQGQHDFAVELLDVEVDITLNVKQKTDKNKNVVKPTKTIHNFEVVGCRSLSFSASNFEYYKERIPVHALISGHLINEIPELLVSHLTDVVVQAISKSDDKSLAVEQSQKPANEGEATNYHDIQKLILPMSDDDKRIYSENSDGHQEKEDRSENDEKEVEIGKKRKKQKEGKGSGMFIDGELIGNENGMFKHQFFQENGRGQYISAKHGDNREKLGLHVSSGEARNPSKHSESDREKKGGTMFKEGELSGKHTGMFKHQFFQENGRGQFIKEENKDNREKLALPASNGKGRNPPQHSVSDSEKESTSEDDDHKEKGSGMFKDGELIGNINGMFKHQFFQENGRGQFIKEENKDNREKLALPASNGKGRNPPQHSVSDSEKESTSEDDDHKEKGSGMFKDGELIGNKNGMFKHQFFQENGRGQFTYEENKDNREKLALPVSDGDGRKPNKEEGRNMFKEGEIIGKSKGGILTKEGMFSEEMFSKESHKDKEKIVREIHSDVDKKIGDSIKSEEDKRPNIKIEQSPSGKVSSVEEVPAELPAYNPMRRNVVSESDDNELENNRFFRSSQHRRAYVNEIHSDK